MTDLLLIVLYTIFTIDILSTIYLITTTILHHKRKKKFASKGIVSKSDFDELIKQFKAKREIDRSVKAISSNKRPARYPLAKWGKSQYQ
jgi:uncharacterized membrane protein YbaN (DUF454 family)